MGSLERIHSNESEGTAGDALLMEVYHDVKQIGSRQEAMYQILQAVANLLSQNTEELSVLRISTLKSNQDIRAPKEPPAGPADGGAGLQRITERMAERTTDRASSSDGMPRPMFRELPPLCPDDLGSSQVLPVGEGRGRRAVWGEEKLAGRRSWSEDKSDARQPSLYNTSMGGVPDGWPGSIKIRKGFERGAGEGSAGGRPTQSGGNSLHSTGSMRVALTVASRDEMDEYSQHRLMLDPNAHTVVVAGLMGLLLVVYDILSTPYVLAYQADDDYALAVMYLISAIYWTAAILLTCRTGFYSQGELQMEPLAVVRYYLRRWFIFDVALVSIDWVTFVSITRPDYDVWRLARSVRILKIFRMAKVFAVLETVANQRFPRARSLLLTLQVFIGTFLFVHVTSCAWHALGTWGPTDTGKRWTTEILAPFDGQYSDAFIYFTSFHWVLSQMTLSGVTDVNAYNAYERAFAIFVITCGLVFSSLVLSICATQASEYVAQRREQMETVAKLRLFMEQHSVPMKLAGKAYKQVLRRIQDHSALLTEQNVSALDMLSGGIRGALLREARMPHLTRHALFRLWAQMDSAALRALCDKAVRLAVHAHQDLLFVPGQLAQEALCIVKGTLRYSQDPETSLVDEATMTEVKQGTWLCEAALWSHWVFVGTLETASSCLILGLNAVGLFGVVTKFPAIADLTRSYGRAFHGRILTSIPPFTPWPTDLLVPCTNASSLLSSSVGLALVQRRYDAGTLNLPEDEYVTLQKQIEEEVCAVLESEHDGELERIVVVSALGLVDESTSLMLAKVGKWKTGQRPVPKCNLPGTRAKSGELPQLALERFLNKELQAFKDAFRVSHTEEAVEVKESERFGLRTRYLRVVHHATLKSGWTHPQLPLAVHATMPVVADVSGTMTKSLASSRTSMGAGLTSIMLRGRNRSTRDKERRTRILETRVIGIAGGSSGADLYAWISKEDFEYLADDRGLKDLEEWICNLEWLTGAPDSAVWQQARDTQGGDRPPPSPDSAVSQQARDTQSGELSRAAV